jgi:hypothetical protein
VAELVEGETMKRRQWHGLVALVGALFVGCSSGSNPEQLKVKAASDLGCREEIQLEILGDTGRGGLDIRKASGCQKELAYLWDYGSEAWVSAFDRAEFDLSCPKAELTAKQLDRRSVGVTGCGKKAVYKVVRGAGWVSNSPSTSAPATEPTPSERK